MLTRYVPKQKESSQLYGCSWNPVRQFSWTGLLMLTVFSLWAMSHYHKLHHSSVHLIIAEAGTAAKSLLVFTLWGIWFSLKRDASFIICSYEMLLKSTAHQIDWHLNNTTAQYFDSVCNDIQIDHYHIVSCDTWYIERRIYPLAAFWLAIKPL
jgi:hypothetical protein